MAKGRTYFNQSLKPTLGVEVELFTVSRDTHNLYPGAPLILNAFKLSYSG